MSLRALAETCGLSCPAGSGETGTGLAFAFDSGYLEPFKTMLFSLYLHGSYLDAPITVYSDDAEIFEHPFVRAVVDRPRPLSGARLETLYRLSRDNVKRAERAAWNKGTFLKWAVFEEQPTQKVLFLDADMIALQDIEPILAEEGRASFNCCPQFQKSLRVSDEGARSPDETGELLDELIKGRHFGGHRSRVNSGVMLLSGEMCSTGFFDEMTGYASQSVELHEQGFFSAYLRTRPGLGRFMPAGLNFQEAYLRNLPWPEQSKLMSRIAILHYAGGGKPWQISPSEGARPSVSLWHWYDFERKRLFDL